MYRSTARSPWRRLTAAGAGTALVAAALSVGVGSPAQAADSVLSGIIADAAGNPLAGYVSIYQLQSDGTYDYLTYDSVEGGHFDKVVADGTYKVEFESYAGYSEYYLDKADLASSDAVVVGGGATALAAWTVDQPYVVGTVTNAKGVPVESASIRASGLDSEGTVSSVTTDKRGNFKLAVPAAPVKLFVQGGYPYAGEWYSDKPSYAAADAVTGSPTGASVGNIVLSAGGSVSGVVTSDAGVPLEHVEVSVGGRIDLTDKAGVYTVEDVPIGTYVVEFSDPLDEYATEYFNNVTDRAAATPVDVGPDQAVGNINAALALAPAPAPGSVEMTGLVKDDLGAPVVGAEVVAWTTPAYEGDRVVGERVRSNRAGVYTFDDLDRVPNENTFKVQAIPGGDGNNDAFALTGSWFGNHTSYERATPVLMTPPTPITGADIVLRRLGGATGTVTGVAGVPLAANVVFMNEDGAISSALIKPDQTFETRSLFPGTYKVRFADASRNHVPEWWKDATFEKATTITVRSGQLTSGLNAVLGAQLVAVERPEIDGFPWVGKPIDVDEGTWNLVAGTEYSYEWLVGSTVVGTGETFTPAKANIGDKLTVRVTAENGRLAGTATTAKTAKVGYQPKVKVKVKGAKASIAVKAKPVKGKKVKGTLVVKELVKVKADGTPKYKKVAKAKIAKGQGAVSLAALKKGKHKLVFLFTGKGKVGSTEVTKKVKTKR